MKAVLFDLDGTLLPMDMDEFLKVYMAGASKVLPGKDPREVAAAIMKGTHAMVMHDDGRTNEEAFWAKFAELVGVTKEMAESLFRRFYEEEFPKLGQHFSAAKGARDAVELCKKKGYRVILATNPVFPAIATVERIRWAGFVPEEFELFTAYEDSRFCKPQAGYYLEVLRRAGGLEPSDCLMVGNDEQDDLLPANKLGMKTFFQSDYPCNCSESPVCDAEGSWPELCAYIEGLG